MNRQLNRIVASVALAVCSGAAFGADGASHFPEDKAFAGTAPFDSSYELTVTSPARPNTGRACDFTGGKIASMAVKTADGTPEEALAWISASAVSAGVSCSGSSCNITYTDFAQGKTLKIDVNVPAAAAAGTYSFDIQTKAPQGCQGFSSSGNAALTVEVAEPGVVDTVPPIVTINAPSNGASYIFCPLGADVSIDFDAVDSQSYIGAMSAMVSGTNVDLTTTGVGSSMSANAQGTFSALWVGGYTLTATAEDVPGNSADATADFGVTYASTWLPPISLGKTGKGGSTVPIKFSVRDCDGNFVVDTSVVVAVWEVTASGDSERFRALFGEGADFVRINEVDEHYIANFQTGSGARNYRVEVYFGDHNGNPYLVATKQFSVR